MIGIGYIPANRFGACLKHRIGQKRLELEEICKNFGLSSAGIIGTFKLVLQLAKSVHYVT